MKNKIKFHYPSFFSINRTCHPQHQFRRMNGNEHKKQPKEEFVQLVKGFGT
jgi:hypothetical protein